LPGRKAGREREKKGKGRAILNNRHLWTIRVPYRIRGVGVKKSLRHCTDLQALEGTGRKWATRKKRTVRCLMRLKMGWNSLARGPGQRTTIEGVDTGNLAEGWSNRDRMLHDEVKLKEGSGDKKKIRYKRGGKTR